MLRALALAALAGLAACSIDPFHPDPVRQAQVDALGPESPSVDPGPYHRPGQACTLCHGPGGTATPAFTVAGTVLATPDHPQGAGGVEVLMVDALGSSPPSGSVITNCAGNFYVTSDLWDPAFPLRVAVVYRGTGAQMQGHVGRDGSCASCHKAAVGLGSPGPVYVGTVPPVDPSCPAAVRGSP
jgi:hypothetical protein